MAKEQLSQQENSENGIKSPEVQLSTESFTLSSSPHVHHPESVQHIMMWVIFSLVPSLIASILFFGFSALFLTCVAVTSAVVTEWAVAMLLKKKTTLSDCSAIVTGILLSFSISPSLPWWMLAIGSAFAIGVVKIPFGGLGYNFVNPALAGRAFLMVSYPTAMTQFSPTKWGSLSGIDGLGTATPLAQFKTALTDGSFQPLDFQDALTNLFLGNVGGCLGATSVLALILGGIVLLYKRIIPLRIPFFFIGTVFFLSWIFNGTNSFFTSGAIIVPFYQIFAGGLFLGAFFMATDMVTSPITPNGKIIFAVGCGVLTFIIRKFGGYPEGVCYAILIMNLFVPLIEQYTRPRIYGEVKHRD